MPITSALQNPGASRGAGDNTSVSSMNMSVLNGLTGSKMLQYVNSKQFGIYGESQKLYEIIQVSSFPFLLLGRNSSPNFNARTKICTSTTSDWPNPTCSTRAS
jgi:hypothetical protein